MKYRKLFFLTLALCFGVTLCIAFFSYIIDRIKNDCGELLDGISGREYNSVIAVRQPFNVAFLGSSMSQGFHCSEFDAAFNKQSLKLTCSGANLAEIKFLADYVYKFKKLDYIILDCNLFDFAHKQTLDDMPLEHYDGNSGLADLKKFFSINAFGDGLQFVRRSLSGKIKYISRDDLYDWNVKSSCGEEYLARALFRQKSVCKIDQCFIDDSAANVQKYLITLFEAHPETKFIIFFPPYSALFYKGMDPVQCIKLKGVLMKLLLGRNNVELYDFQTEFSITENLNNYKDLTHYSGKINSWMIKCFKERKYLVTEESFRKILQLHYKQMTSYDYQKKYDDLKCKYKK